MYANIFIYLLFLVALCIGVALGWLIGRMRLQNSFGEERAQLISSRDVLKVQLGMLANQRDEDRKQQEQQLVELRQQHKEQLEQQMTLIREQMNSASEKILRDQRTATGGYPESASREHQADA